MLMKFFVDLLSSRLHRHCTAAEGSTMTETQVCSREENKTLPVVYTCTLYVAGNPGYGEHFKMVSPNVLQCTVLYVLLLLYFYVCVLPSKINK